MGNLASTVRLQRPQERVPPAHASSVVPAWAQLPGLEPGGTGAQQAMQLPQFKIHITELFSCPIPDPEDEFWQKGFWHIW